MNACVYVSDTAVLNDKDLYDKVYRIVSDTRRAKTDRLRIQRDRNLSLGAEYLLIRACRDFGVDFYNERIVMDSNGKPGFESCPLFFNLSHSEERAMCIMSDVPVGCDVEKIHHAEQDIAERFFAPDECLALKRCSDEKSRENLFYRLWTLNESFVKCTGLGLKLPLDSFSIGIEKDKIVLDQSFDDMMYTMCEHDCSDGYRYACCIRDKDASVEWKKIGFDDLI